MPCAQPPHQHGAGLRTRPRGPAHHARVEVAGQSAVSMRRALALAGQHQAEVSDAQGMEPRPLCCPPASEVGAGVPRAGRGQVGRVAIGGRVQHLEARLGSFLPFIQDPGHSRHRCQGLRAEEKDPSPARSVQLVLPTSLAALALSNRALGPTSCRALPSRTLCILF